ncbi:hypothetical protein [Flavobacterium ovatum]|uniref:hypothetical protein n=1 Tax=Flavobacterium ovatum TaxID=1928857 RepID=UPI00344E2A0B
MYLNEKILFLEQILSLPEDNFADSFKTDIAFYFDEDFSIENTNLSFLENFQSKTEIENWVSKLTSRFVLKFDADFESENDFIYDYLTNG